MSGDATAQINDLLGAQGLMVQVRAMHPQWPRMTDRLAAVEQKTGVA